MIDYGYTMPASKKTQVRKTAKEKQTDPVNSSANGPDGTKSVKAVIEKKGSLPGSSGISRNMTKTQNVRLAQEIFRVKELNANPRVLKLSPREWIWKTDMYPFPPEVIRTNSQNRFLEGLTPAHVVISPEMPPRVRPSAAIGVADRGLPKLNPFEQSSVKAIDMFKGFMPEVQNDIRNKGLAAMDDLLGIFLLDKLSPAPWRLMYWRYFLRPTLQWCADPERGVVSHCADWLVDFVESAPNKLDTSTALYTRVKLFFFTGLLLQFNQRALATFLWDGAATLGEIKGAALEQRIMNMVGELSPDFEGLFHHSGNVMGQAGSDKPTVIFQNEFKKIWSSEDQREYTVASRQTILVTLLQKLYLAHEKGGASVRWEDDTGKYTNLHDLLRRTKAVQPLKDILRRIIVEKPIGHLYLLKDYTYQKE